MEKDSATGRKAERGRPKLPGEQSPQTLRNSPQAGPVVRNQDGVAGISGIVFDAGGLPRDEPLQPDLALQASDILRGLIGDPGNQITVGDQMARAHVFQRPRARAEQTFACFLRFRRPLHELNDLSFGACALLLQDSTRAERRHTRSSLAQRLARHPCRARVSNPRTGPSTSRLPNLKWGMTHGAQSAPCRPSGGRTLSIRRNPTDAYSTETPRVR
jgi:hypothetical protein